MNKSLKTAFIGMFAMLSSALPAHADYYGNDYCCQPAYGSYYDCCDCCNNFWGSAEYLYWKIQDSPQPVPLVLGADDFPVYLDSPGSHLLLGGKKIKNDWDSGARFSLGYWIDDCRTFGVEASYFILPYHTKKRSVSSPGSGYPVLAVPFFDSFDDIETSYPFAVIPAGANGKASLKLRNRMQGAELNAVWALPTCSCNFNVSLLGGFRWWNFDESLTFKTQKRLVAAPPYLSDTKDKFSTQNNFYGGQLGVGLDYTCDCFFANITGKVALGANSSKLDINGSYLTNFFQPDFPLANGVFYEGGIFAQGTNSGSHKKTYFAVIPEVEANFGYQITECFRVKVGYNFLWVNKVLRPGSQIDRNINPTQAPVFGGPDATLVGDPSPRAFHKTNSIWAQGVNVGFDFSF